MTSQSPDVADPITLKEPPAAKEAFLDYCMLGMHRSLTRLRDRYEEKSRTGLEIPTKSVKLLAAWSAKYNWVKRVADWDDARLKEREDTWKERQQQLRESNWEMGEKLRDLANQMLETAPKFIRQKRQFIPGTQGNPDREIITLGMKEESLMRLVEVASALQTQAVGSERTTTITPDGAGGIKVKATDFNYNSAIDVLKPESVEDAIVNEVVVKALEAGQNRNDSESEDAADAPEAS